MTEFVLHLLEQHLPGILGSVWWLSSTLGLKPPFTLRSHCGPLKGEPENTPGEKILIVS